MINGFNYGDSRLLTADLDGGIYIEDIECRQPYEDLLNVIITRYLDDAKLSVNWIKSKDASTRSRGHVVQAELNSGSFYNNPMLHYYDKGIISIIKKEADKYVVNQQ